MLPGICSYSDLGLKQAFVFGLAVRRLACWGAAAKQSIPAMRQQSVNAIRLHSAIKGTFEGLTC